MDDSLLDRYRRDHSPQSAARLMEEFYPLVCSVCRRYLRHSQDAEDAAQETFIKLLRHADTIGRDVRGWLTTTAYSTSIDLIRRASSARRREQNRGRLLPAAMEQRLVHEAIFEKLHEALLKVDDSCRLLLIERFIRKTPLRVIAGQQAASIGTISRRTSKALSDLAAVLRDMGVASADDFTVAEHFGDPANLLDVETVEQEGLRFAPDWREAAAPAASAGFCQPCVPGWSRPIRVGAFLSYSTSTLRDLTATYLPMDYQVHSLDFLWTPGFDLVGLVEPGTTHRGPVESTLRRYGLTAGLIDASDRAAVETLDVILLGTNHAIARPIVHAINQAVRSGVGLLKEWWLGLGTVAEGPSTWTDPEAAELLLAGSPVYNYHLAHCGIRVPATVREEHPLLPNLAKGSQLLTSGCGPVYRPLPSARVLVSKNYVVSPEEHKIAGLGPIAPPAYIAGQLGRGRVVVVQALFHGRLWTQALGDKAYMANLLTWLAEPRREQALAMLPTNRPSRRDPATSVANDPRQQGR